MPSNFDKGNLFLGSWSQHWLARSSRMNPRWYVALNVLDALHNCVINELATDWPATSSSMCEHQGGHVANAIDADRDHSYFSQSNPPVPDGSAHGVDCVGGRIS